jgi:hypothetical protein
METDGTTKGWRLWRLLELPVRQCWNACNTGGYFADYVPRQDAKARRNQQLICRALCAFAPLREN